jgi:signal transduction histidine kinase
VVNSERRADTSFRFARAACLVAAAVVTALFAVAVPARLAQLHTVCPVAVCANGQLTAEDVVLLETRRVSVEAYAVATTTIEVGFAGVFFALAALIFWRRPAERIALVVALLFVTFGASYNDVLEALAAQSPDWSGPVTLLEDLSFVAFFYCFCIFPDAHFVPRWTRLVAAGWLTLVVLDNALPGSAFDSDTWPAEVRSAAWLSLLGIPIGAQVYRYVRVSGAQQRQQTKWVILGTATALAGWSGVLLLDAQFAFSSRHADPTSLAAGVALYGFLLLIPVSIAIAILRYGLWAVDPILRRALIYAALTTCVIASYVVVVGYLGAVFRTRDNLVISLVATGIVAVFFQPLRSWLQRSVSRLLYGERDEPYVVLARLGQRLEGTLAPDSVLPAVVETIAAALKLPYVALQLDQDGEHPVAAARGSPTSETLRLPLVYQNEPVGALVLAPRSPGETFTAAERRLLDDLARQAGIAVHAVRLTTELRRARERLVSAREEERRRLRRDLHDGLGPLLGSLTLKLDVADDLVEPDPAAARALLHGLKEQAQTATADIRRLVHALRPPALDDLGLAAALYEGTQHCEQAGLRVTVDLPERLPPLPAAVEVAAYRIAQEALTNIVRHAAARSCHVRLTLDDSARALQLEIGDDGRGLPLVPRRGVGLASMRERAEELGGTCEVTSRPEGGTCVRARLPV